MSKNLIMAWPAKADELPLIPNTARRFPLTGMKIDGENPSFLLLLNDGSLTTEKPGFVAEVEKASASKKSTK